MQWPLVVAGLAMGLAATPHCAVMCGAPCAALTSPGASAAGGFHTGRMTGYMAAGAVAAASVSALAAWSDTVPALRPAWTLLHLGFLGLGFWWLATGRQPAWLLARGPTGAVQPLRFHRRRRAVLRASVGGLAWVAWPCAALNGALLLAALGNSAATGALVMGGFAIGSMPGLAAAPWAWGRWRALRGAPVGPAAQTALGFRVAGLGLALVSGWALTEGVWQRLAAWCMA